MRRLVLSLLTALPAPAFADEKQTAPPPYTNQGPFVTYPALIASSPVTQVGYVLGAVTCLPFSIAKDAKGEGDQKSQPSRVCGKAVSTALGWPVYAAVGLPFFLLKQLFWDGPRALIGRSSPQDKTLTSR